MKMSLKTPFYLVALVGLLLILGVGLVFIKNRFGSQPAVKTLPKVEATSDQLINGFPDFPTYPGATVTSSQHTQTTSAPEYSAASYQAFLETADSPATVINWYVTNLQAAGWQIVRPVDSSQADDQNVVLSKAAQVATINVEHEPSEGSTISIFIK